MSKKARDVVRNVWQQVSTDIVPHVDNIMTCARCGAPECVIVPNVNQTFDGLQGVGASQHAMLCSEACAERPWQCFKCEEGANVPDHAPYCEVAHPGYRAEWDETHDVATMRLAAMVAARGQFLPAFLMDAIFPGFTHADPANFAAFKASKAEPK